MKFRKHYLEDYLRLDGAKIMSLFEEPNLWMDGGVVSDGLSNFLDSILMEQGYGKAYEESPDVLPFECSDAKYNSFSEFAADISDTQFIDNTEAKFSLRAIPRISIVLYILYPEYAFPYLFPQHFYILQAICKEFEIEIPDIPPKKDNIARFRYYVEICRAMYEFRIKHGLSPAELCAFVYGFALRDVEAMRRNSDKEPTRIFMVHASAADQNGILAKEFDKETVGMWQGSDGMRIGDIVLMYECSPSKSFGSVWRAVTPGFDDPFDLYQGKVFLGNPVRIPKVAFSDLLADPIWRNKPEVNAHMQGGSGRACSVDEYEALKSMIHKKDPVFDLSKLPLPPPVANFNMDELNVEHDVELKLLEPLLIKLGFKENDWVRQLSVRIGRDNSSRPDYVVGLKKAARGYSADLVFEAKLTIPNTSQLEKDYGQALAYAGILSSRVATLVAREGIWIYTKKDKFDFDKGTHYTWANLEDANTIVELSKLYKPNIIAE